MAISSSYHEESALLLALSKGDAHAFAELFRAHQRGVYSFAYRVTRSESASEDIMQDVFLRLWQRREQATSIENLGAYLHTSAHNAAVRSMQQVAREELALHVLKEEKKSGNEAADGSDQLIIAREVREQIQSIIDQMSNRQREVFLLTRDGGLSREEVAAKLGIGAESVKSHLAEATRKLREGLGHLYGKDSLIILILFGISASV